MTTLDISTVAFPDSGLLEAVRGRLGSDADALNLVVYSGEEAGPGTRADEIDALVLPYLRPGSTLKLLGGMGRLKLVQTQSTGFDGVADAAGEGVAIATAQGVHASGTAELALGLTLASLRGIDEAARNMTTEAWDHQRFPSLADRKVLLVGVGGIGEEIAQRLDPFDVELTRVGTRARDDDRGHVHAVSELPDLLPHAEVVILITPLTPGTQGLVNAEFLAALPDGALIVNVARGKVVDTDALVAELQSGRLHAALDVTDPEPLPAGHPLWSAPNTLITPHVAGDSSAFVPRIEKLLAEQLRRIAAGEDLINRVV